MSSLRLKCLIEGEDTVFPVTATYDYEVSDLKESIQAKRAQGSLKDIGPHTLELWKVNIDLETHDEDSLRHLKLGNLEGIEKLTPWKSILQYWSDQPPATFLHIVVVAPAAEHLSKRRRLNSLPPHTPPAQTQVGTAQATSLSPRLTRQETEAQLVDALAAFEVYIEHLATGKLDGYLDSFRPEDKVTCPGVHLPTSPILLIHDLGKHSDRERIEQLFTDGIVHLFNVSGSGKTRLTLDGLCSNWGLYISCKAQGLASGSNDFMKATEMLQTMTTWGKGTSDEDISKNASAAHRAFAMLLCARFFVLKQLVEHLPLNTDVTVARRRWVLAQALPPRLQSGPDLFVTVLQNLRRADKEVMVTITYNLITSITTKRPDLFPENITPLFLVIDEAQMAADHLKDFFRSESGNHPRPILRAMVNFCTSIQIFAGIILSGTGLSMDKVKTAVGSSSAKRIDPQAEHTVFTDVGCFTRDGSSQETYINRYLNLSKDSISDQRLLERMVYWLSGRYRLTASLIELLLHESANLSRHRVLTTFTKRMTGFKITDAIQLEDGEPPISPKLEKKINNYRPLTELHRLFEVPELPNRETIIQCLVDTLMRWTLTSELTSIPIKGNMHETIALGVGFLQKAPCTIAYDPDVNYPVYISEPLVVLALNWLFEQYSWTTKKEYMIRLFRNALNRSALGFVLEEGLLLVLMEIFGGKSIRLADAFHCNVSLGSRRVILISLKRVAGDIMQSCPVSWEAGSSDRLGLKAGSPIDVLKFLDNPDGKAFLFPDTHMGPGLLCFLQDEETKELILLAMQSKSSPSLKATAWQDALDSVTPRFFYTLVADGRRVQYASVTYPNLVDELTKTLETVLGQKEDAPIINTYRSKLRSSTQALQQSTSDSTRQTPRFLRIIATADDENHKKKCLEERGVGVLRWDKVEEYIGSTADLVKNYVGVVF